MIHEIATTIVKITIGVNLAMTISGVVTVNVTTFTIDTATLGKMKTVVEVIEVKNVREVIFPILESALKTGLS